ncbi:MAG: hypothetical protein ACKO1O_01100 [Erythrobacter sp.]
MSALGLILASGALGTMAAEAQQSAQPIRIRKPAPAPSPTATPTPDLKKVDLGLPGPPPPKFCLPGKDCSKKEEPKTPPPPAAKPQESKDSFGEPAEVFKWVLTQPLQPQTFSWQVGAPPTLLPKVETHICLLTEVSGKFQGAGEKVHLAVDKGANGGARYVLRGDGASGYVRAVATCAGREKFVPIADKAGTGVADERGLRQFSNCQSEMQLTQKNNILARAPFLTMVSGKFQGEGESLAADVGGESGAVQRGMGCSGYVAGAITLHGNEIWPAVRYRTQTSRTTKLTEATFVSAFKAPSTSALGEFLAGKKFSAGGAPIWMVPVDEALCGLTMIAGKFQGYGEAAQIRAVKNSDGQMWWQLAVTNQTNGGTVVAGARCIARDQRGALFGG